MQEARPRGQRRLGCGNTQPRDHLLADPCSVCIHLSCNVFELVPVNDGLADISGDRVEPAGANDVDAFGLMERNYI